MRGHRPSPALLVAFVALVVALGGTALAATGQLVNIGDPSAASHVAKVDSSGALKTAVATSTTAFNGFAIPGSPQILIGPTKASLALTRLVLTNDDGTWARVLVYQFQGTESGCALMNATRWVGVYDVGPHATQTDAMPTPVILKSRFPGEMWCLKIEWATSSGGGSIDAAWSGYTVSGTAPANASSQARGALPQLRRAH